MKAVGLSADGLPLHYEVYGDGAPALVFVHGWSCDRRYWSGQLDYFADRYQVVAIDLAGHGESGLGRQAWTMPGFGEDVVAVVEQLGLSEMVLIGHSMGGDVIVEAALRLPGRVAGLVWVDTYSTLGESSPPEEVEEFVVPFRVDFVTATRDFVRQRFLPDSDADLVEWVAADMSAAPPKVAVDALEHAITNDGAILAGLRKVPAPVVAINPDHWPTDYEALERYGVKVVLMPGVGHWLMMEDPDTFNASSAKPLTSSRSHGPQVEAEWAGRARREASCPCRKGPSRRNAYHGLRSLKHSAIGSPTGFPWSKADSRMRCTNLALAPSPVEASFIDDRAWLE